MAGKQDLFDIIMGLMKHGMTKDEAIKAVESGKLATEYAGKAPENTVDAFKMFRQGDDGQMYPLFVEADRAIPQGEWLFSALGASNPSTGKVKSKIGDLAYRGGWHAGDSPIATHIGGKSRPELKAPDYRKPNQVWAPIQMGNDFDWQSEAAKRMEYSKAGKPIPRTAHITDQLPFGGHYRYKTNPNMTGEWLIGGEMKVGNQLSPAEVKAINDAKGLADLPQLDEVIEANGLNKADLTREALADVKKYYPQLFARMKSLALPATATGVAGTQSEDAEAVPWKSGVDALDRMLKTGMISAQSAGDPKLVQRAFNKYKKNWDTSPAFREREQRAFEADEFVKFSETELGGRIVADLEKMVGRPIMPIRGDRSNIGLIEQIGGMDVNVPVEGGNKYSLEQAGTDNGWASMFTVAKSVQNKINQIAKDTDMSPIAIYNAMGENATDFSTPIAEAMLKEARSLPLNKEDIKMFDEYMRTKKGYDGSQRTNKDGSLKFNKDGTPDLKPNWVGLESENAMDQLMGTGDFPMEGAGKMRTAFATLMGMDEFRKRGFPSYTQLIDATRDPALLGAEIGESGLSMFDTIVRNAEKGTSTHKSYDTAIGGNYSGGLPDMRGVPFDIMFPELYKYARSLKNKKGAPLTHDQAIVAANIRKDGYQIADQSWLDGVMEYLEKNGKRNALAGISGVGAGMANAGQSGGVDFKGEMDFRNWMESMQPKQQGRGADVGSISAIKAPDFDKADYYHNAGVLADQAGQTFKNIGVPSSLVDFFTPDYSTREAQAMGDTSLENDFWNLLTGVDPTEAIPNYAGLMAELIRRNR